MVLISIEGVRNHIKVPGLKFILKTPENIATYQVNLPFAKFLARDLSNAVFCSKPTVYEVNLMFEEKRPGEFFTTGTVCVSSDKRLSGAQLNAYNHFAQIIMRNSNLRQTILDDLIEDLYFIVKPDGFSVRFETKSLDDTFQQTLH